MQRITVHLNARSYDVIVKKDCLPHTGTYVKRLGLGTHACIITSRMIDRLYGHVLKRSLAAKKIRSFTVYVRDGEASKSLTTYTRCVEKIAQKDRGEKPFIIGLGGGVIGDLTGFIAATYRRGIHLIHVPTTLVAQLDSAIGGKTALDLSQGKNLIGTFYQPRLVLGDTSVLATLPKREIRCGLAEAIKYSLLDGPGFFSYLEKNSGALVACEPRALGYIIRRGAAMKARIVSRDERDTKDIRIVLNLGHTIGHALEAAAGYKKCFTHGEAVAVGLVASCRLGETLGVTDPALTARVQRLLARVGLPIRASGLSAAKVYNALTCDKKFSRGINAFLVPERVGRVKVMRGINAQTVSRVVNKSIKG